MRPLFAFSGQISRAEFWHGHLVLLALTLAWCLALALGLALGAYTLVLGIGFLVLFFTMAYGILGAGLLALGLSGLVARRARAVGFSGWTALLLAVPLVNLGWWLYLGLVATDRPSATSTALIAAAEQPSPG